MSGLSEYGGDFGPFCDARKEEVLVEKFGGATVVAIGFPFLKIASEESVEWRWFADWCVLLQWCRWRLDPSLKLSVVEGQCKY